MDQPQQTETQQPQIDIDTLRDYLGNEVLGKIQLLSMIKAQAQELEKLKKDDEDSCEKDA